MIEGEGSSSVARLKLITSMVIFGTIGIFVRYISMPSSIIALVRGFIGVVFLLLLTLISKRKISAVAVKNNIVLLLLSGAAIGINWILLFEAYNYTTVATATLCYYFAPIFVMIMSPIVLKQKLGLKKVVCVFTALLGMTLVSGVTETGLSGVSDFKGILFGIGAAVFYASVILMNQGIKNISAYDKTIFQLLFASVVLLPYTLLTENFSELSPSSSSVIMLVLVGVIHTGLAYTLYFGSMKDLTAQSVALMSYIDPICAIILSAFVLKERMSLLCVIGAVLVLGSTLVSEIPINHLKGKRK